MIVGLSHPSQRGGQGRVGREEGRVVTGGPGGVGGAAGLPYLRSLPALARVLPSPAPQPPSAHCAGCRDRAGDGSPSWPRERRTWAAQVGAPRALRVRAASGGRGSPHAPAKAGRAALSGIRPRPRTSSNACPLTGTFCWCRGNGTVRRAGRRWRAQWVGVDGPGGGTRWHR